MSDEIKKKYDLIDEVLIKDLEQESGYLRLDVENEGVQKDTEQRFLDLVKDAEIKYNEVPIKIAKNLAIVREKLITDPRLNLFLGVIIHILLVLLGWYWVNEWFIWGKFNYTYIEDFVWQLFLYFMSYTLIVSSLRSLTHLVIGLLSDIKFRGFLCVMWWYPAFLEIEYESYLEAGFAKRKILHISGMIETWGITIYYSYIAYSDPLFLFLPIFIFLIYLLANMTKNDKIVGDLIAFKRENRNSYLYNRIRIMKVKEAIRKKKVILK